MTTCFLHTDDAFCFEDGNDGEDWVRFDVVKTGVQVDSGGDLVLSPRQCHDLAVWLLETAKRKEKAHDA